MLVEIIILTFLLAGGILALESGKDGDIPLIRILYLISTTISNKRKPYQ